MPQPEPYEVVKNWLGRWLVKYPCAKCGEVLRSPLSDAGSQDDCPACYNHFLVPGVDELARVSAGQKAAEEHKAKLAADRAEAKRLQAIRLHAMRDEARKDREASAERVKERRAAEEAREAQLQAIAPAELDLVADTSPKRGLPWRTFALPTGVAILIAIYILARGSDLRSKLAQCESQGVVTARVSYAEFFGTDTVVFDLRDGSSASARRIDPVHLLLQFASKLDLHSVKNVVLARNGDRRFSVAGADLLPLAESYENGGRVWSFNNLPSKVCRMDGTHPFGVWSGGWLGVLKEQSEDLNEFITNWTDD